MAKKNTIQKIVKRGLAVLLMLALAGTVLFAFFQDKINRWEYPIQYSEYVTYYADKYDIDPLMLYAFIRTESNLIRWRILMQAHGAYADYRGDV